jgi:hypothetical protein
VEEKDDLLGDSAYPGWIIVDRYNVKGVESTMMSADLSQTPF